MSNSAFPEPASPVEPAQPVEPMQPVTLDNCDREPIHIPGQIQPHGALLAFDLSGVLTYCSANAQALLGPGLPALNERLARHHFSGCTGFHELVKQVREATDAEVIPHALSIVRDSASFYVIAHRTERGLICEFEQTLFAAPAPDNFSFMVHRAIARLKLQRNADELLSIAVEEVRRMTGFDRVMAYRFRHDDSGDVVAESADPALKPYLGMRYPASDIPAQARRLYVINTLRLIADMRAAPVPVVSLQGRGEPLDMSHCVLRSVSPVHIEYLSNMGVGASMSVSIVIGNKLWGMLVCHHMKPRHVPYNVRLACDELAQILASSVQGALAKAHAVRVDAAASLRSRLVEQLLHADDITLALSAEAPALCESVGAHGAVVADGARIQVYGGVPWATGTALLHWLNSSGLPLDRMTHLDTIETLPPALRAQMGMWCGLLALPFGMQGPCWLVLLRKEQVETISWGGKPEKELVTGPFGARLTPRGSFDLWRETVSGKAVPWDAIDLESAQKLFDELHLADATHTAGVSRVQSYLLVMLNAELEERVRQRTAQLEAANQELQAFSYSVSHDLRSPLKTINGFSHLLERALGSEAGEKQKHYLSRIRAGTRQMGELIDGLLTLAQLSRETLQWSEVDLSAIAKRVVQGCKERDAARQVQVQIAKGMRAMGDARLLSVVIENLVGNAWKFTSRRQLAHIEIGRQHGTSGQSVFFVKDDGAGFDMAHAEKLFGTFERLHSPSDFSGTGIGLATVKRVIERHAGRIWAQGKENEGATFYFTLPDGDLPALPPQSQCD